MKISQSIIKEVLAYGLCPKKFKAYYLDNDYEREPSVAMFNGIYFEYEVLGNLPKSGEVPVYPLNKKGKYPVAKTRIDEQIKNFPKIMAKEGIQVLGGVENIEWKYSQSVTITLTLDSMVYYKGLLYVGDTKLSMDINSTFGPVAWGNYEQMDKLQAHLYSYVMSQVMGEPVGFLYIVFDYKASKREYRIFEEHPSKVDKDDMFKRLAEAERKMRWMEYVDYKPRAYEDTCKSCKIQDCIARFKPGPTPESEAFVKPVGKTTQVSVDELLSIMIA